MPKASLWGRNPPKESFRTFGANSKAGTNKKAHVNCGLFLLFILTLQSTGVHVIGFRLRTTTKQLIKFDSSLRCKCRKGFFESKWKIKKVFKCTSVGFTVSEGQTFQCYAVSSSSSSLFFESIDNEQGVTVIRYFIVHLFEVFWSFFP